MAANEDLLASLMNEQPATSGGNVRYTAPGPAARPAQKVSSYERAKPRRPAKQGLLDRLAPGWALRVAERIEDEGADFRSLIALFSLLITAFGLSLFVGGGYYSIQAVRLALAAFGVAVTVTGIPSIQWWLIPLGNSAVQVVGRRVWRPAWWASLWYDATTTGVGIMSRGTLLLSGAGLSLGAIYNGTIGAIIGMGFALGAEALFFGGLVMLRASLKR